MGTVLVLSNTKEKSHILDFHAHSFSIFMIRSNDSFDSLGLDWKRNNKRTNVQKKEMKMAREKGRKWQKKRNEQQQPLQPQ